jgi:hypothetical protein
MYRVSEKQVQCATVEILTDNSLRVQTTKPPTNAWRLLLSNRIVRERNKSCQLEYVVLNASFAETPDHTDRRHTAMIGANSVITDPRRDPSHSRKSAARGREMNRKLYR